MATIIKIRKKTYKFVLGESKSDIARFLLAEDDRYTVSEISKAVPMAYSQAHSVAQKMPPSQQRPPAKKVDLPTKPIASYAGGKRPTSKGRVAEAKVWAGKKADEIIGRTNIVVSPLRAHGKRPLGKCANCGFDLIETIAGKERLMVHTGETVEDYYAKVQFCHAFPASLL